MSRGLSLETYWGLGHVVVRSENFSQLPTVDELFMERYGQDRKIEILTTAFNLAPQFLIGASRIATLQQRLAKFYQR